jgi:REP element-mobilizing transposase RayT
MGRKPRIERGGGIFHVTSRATGHERLFRDDRDRIRFLGLLDQCIRAKSWRCYAYCLMDTHVHLVLRTDEPNLGAGMRWLKTRYATAFNTRHGRDGHLFGDRYFAGLLERESHVISALLYVALNPVRAGLVAAAEDFAWSSYRATAGLVEPLALLDSEGAVTFVAGSPGPEGRRRYAESVRRAARDEDR